MNNSKRLKDPSTTLRTNSASGIRVAVGMSGGVDSSVTALLLKQQGYDVVGFFMKLWHDPCGTGENACCDERAQMDARKVADLLQIPFYVVDVREPFKKEVTDYFIREYKNLRTPNPCVVCNKKIKFGWLLDFALKNGCDFLSTGHYSRIARELPMINDQLPIDGKAHLLKAVDTSKDQSYFLSGLDQDQLAKVILPLGDLTKKEVRRIAKDNNLPVYEKAESQEICFVEDDYRDFLKRNMTENFDSGEIVDLLGNVIGSHNGLINYTIGQRKGVAQSQKSKVKSQSHNPKVKNKVPLYVVEFNPEKNQLIVGEDSDLFKDRFTIKSISLIDENTNLSDHANLTVKIRSRAPEVRCKIEKDSDTVLLSTPVRAVTPGQFAVFYDGEEVLGQGEIISD